MNSIAELKNTIQNYAWGSRHAIPRLMGRPTPSDKPEAELWMGSHPKAPSRVKIESRWVPLPDCIEKQPTQILGEPVVKKHGNQLPFLFKVLAAQLPLSIQAHPSQIQAIAGYERENRLGIDLHSPLRNFRDANHKPECICALDRFWALNGFRDPADIFKMFRRISPCGLDKEMDALQMKPANVALERFFWEMFSMDPLNRSAALERIARKAGERAREDAAWGWVATLHDHYPADPGVLAPIILNLVCLEPGEAMFLASGRLHAYLKGTGIELMANSDNVIRGGLTPKHIDVDTLSQVVHFGVTTPHIMRPQPLGPVEHQYPVHAQEFVLSVLRPAPGYTYTSPDRRSVEILLCTQGRAEILSSTGKRVYTIRQGQSALIPAAAPRYQMEGQGTLYRAGVPI